MEVGQDLNDWDSGKQTDLIENEKSVLQIKSKERLNDNATYIFTLSQNLFSDFEINFVG